MNRKERRRLGLPKFSTFLKTNKLFFDFCAAFLPDGHKTLPQTPSFENLRRVVTLLMHPPAQPASPPLDFIVIKPQLGARNHRRKELQEPAEHKADSHHGTRGLEN